MEREVKREKALEMKYKLKREVEKSRVTSKTINKNNIFKKKYMCNKTRSYIFLRNLVSQSEEK